MGCKIILKTFGFYNPINEFLAERGIDFLQFQQEIKDCINLKDLSLNSEGIQELTRSVSVWKNQKDLDFFKKTDQKKFEENFIQSLTVLVKEFLVEKNPHFKK